jgi:hypothetical protein
MHRGFKFLISGIPLIGLEMREIRMKIQTENFFEILISTRLLKEVKDLTFYSVYPIKKSKIHFELSAILVNS